MDHQRQLADDAIRGMLTVVRRNIESRLPGSYGAGVLSLSDLEALLRCVRDYVAAEREYAEFSAPRRPQRLEPMPIGDPD